MNLKVKFIYFLFEAPFWLKGQLLLDQMSTLNAPALYWGQLFTRLKILPTIFLSRDSYSSLYSSNIKR